MIVRFKLVHSTPSPSLIFHQDIKKALRKESFVKALKMSRALVSILLILSVFCCTEATWCVCKQGLNESVLQKTIDYACGNGADCSGIQQGGPCYLPNQVLSHCSYAANSYFQSKSQATGSCDFSGTATITTNDPSPGNGCIYSSENGNTSSAPTVPVYSPVGSFDGSNSCHRSGMLPCLFLLLFIMFMLLQIL